MGGIIQGIFGGGQSTPEPVEYKSEPVRENTIEPESKAVRQEEQRRLKARRAMSGTLLTSPLGVTGSSGNSGSSGILGKLG